MHPARLRPRLRSAIVLGLALALWFASTLGLVHGTLHGHGSPLQPAPTLQAGAQPDSGAASGLGKLFDGHANGDGPCRLFDQLSGGQALPGVPPVLLPLVLPAASLHFFQGETLARWVALFDARGPPVAR